MANHPSAEKRHRQAEKRREHNRFWKSRIRNAAKKVTDAVAKKDKKAAEASLKTVMAEVMKAEKEGVIHANTASRKIARISRAVARI
jgi:small subunit ribosomal protein S20